ncbi:MAG TPA: hypothetical protein VKA30_02035 [Actinomycetota bacterium]|nr:hypothetical protein [Actinomycetota bacterium]
MKKLLLAGLVGAVLITTLGAGVASAYPVAPRAKATVAAPAVPSSPTAGPCFNLDKDNRSLCLLGGQPNCADQHAIVDLSPIVAFYRCGRPPTPPAPTPQCFNIDFDQHTVCIFGGQPGGDCRPGILNLKPLIVYYTCSSQSPLRRILKRLPG